MFDDLDDAMLLGTGYAFLRHGQDRQAEAIIQALRALAADRDDDEDDDLDSEPDPAPIAVQPNMLDFSTVDIPDSWDDYIGQEPLKAQINVRLSAAKNQGRRAPHMLFASGYPGVGKTLAARLTAKTMGVNIIEMQPPFKIDAIVQAALQLDDGDVLFIDEIHKLTDGVGKRGAEILLKILEDHLAFLPSGEVVDLPDVTVIGATTNKGQLPGPVVQRFKLTPYFQPYTLPELGRICVQYAWRTQVENEIPNDLAATIAKACRGTPRIIEEFVDAASDLADHLARPASPQEFLAFMEVEPDGMTRTHIHYLTALRQYFVREARDGGVEYVAGEANMMQMLHEDRPGIAVIERFLVERGLLDRTPRGRRLTTLGVQRAEEFIATGKGVRDVA